MERACCPRAWWTSRATSRRARWWRSWGMAGSSRAGSSTSTPASCAGSAAPRRVTSRRGSATRASTKSSTATTSCCCDGGPRNGPAVQMGAQKWPPYPPTLGAARGTRAAPRSCAVGVTMDVRQLVESKARAARAAAQALAVCGTRVKDEALAQMARALEEKTSALLEANRADLERARTKGLTRAFLDRLTLSEARIEEMANGLRQIAALPDPVGTVVESWRRPNGIEISRVRVPLGVVDRAAVAAMLEQDRYLDLVIPRGGEEFVRWVAERSRVPVLKHDKGVVHVFVEAGAELRGCPRTRALVPSARPATETDWDEEYLDLVLAIRVVDGLDEAIEHIRAHGTGLAEAIVTGDPARARRFTREVDAAGVLVNASPRLLDGNQFGMGAEMGISTSRVHARGPVGVRELTTTKFVVQGDGQVRE